MARKLRTGFEFPFSNATGSDQSKTINLTDYSDIFLGTYSMGWLSSPGFSGGYSLGQNSQIFKFATDARTLSNGTRGVYLNLMGGGGPNGYSMAIDLTKFSNGYYECGWCKQLTAFDSNRYAKPLYFYDGTDHYGIKIYGNGVGGVVIDILKNNVMQSTDTIILSVNTWYFYEISLDNSGVITITYNGTPVTYNSGVTFSNIQQLAALYSSSETNRSRCLDDVAINDGSGASDNGLPNSIRGYNFFDAATLNTNSGFSAVGGTTVLANLQDGSDSTRVSTSADLSYIDFSLPTLSGTGMSETAANFTKIEAINLYGRQIEATKTNSLLKAKITDTVAVVNREESLTLPLTVGNGSGTMFDDGSSDWVLANLDSGDMDFRVTFDKP